MRKFLASVVMFLSIATLLTACSENKQHNGVTVTVTDLPETTLVGNIPCEFPLTESDTTLKMMITKYGNVDPESVFVWQKYEQMTGVDIEWTQTTKSERDEAVYTALVNKTKLDLILRCKISASKLLQYGENGLVLDLAKDGMLEKYAPNCWAYLSTHPDALASITNPDGTIYALPQINSGAELRVSRKIFINKKWLENVNMNIPTTTEEFYLLMKAFKEQDANGNGDPNDEIPLCPADWLSIQEAFYGSFGLANRGVHNLSFDCDTTTGKVRMIQMRDGYKSFLEYFNKLYTEGIIEKSAFSIKSEQWTSYAENDRIGAFASTNLASLPSDKANNWVAVEEALTGPDGDKMWSAIRANFHSTGAAVIPASCSNPELVLRWLDYFWTDEGTLFYHMGVENETFTVDGNNTYDYSAAIYDEITDSGKTFDDVVATYSPYPGGSNPTVEIAPYFKGGEMAEIPASAARKLFEYGPEEYWPSFTFTTEENERLTTLQSDISKYCSSSMEEFITGTKPLSDWESYKERLNALGTDEMVSIYQAAADRYAAMKQ